MSDAVTELCVFLTQSSVFQSSVRVQAYSFQLSSGFHINAPGVPETKFEVK